MPPRRLATLCVTIGLTWFATPLAAHDLERTRVTLDFTRDGRFELEVWNDADWLVQRLERFTDAAPGRLRPVTPSERNRHLARLAPLFLDRVVLFVDGHEVRPADVEFVAPASDDAGLRPLARYRLRGRMPLSARTLRWYYGLVVDPYLLEIRRADGRHVTEHVLGDAWSTSLDLGGQFAPLPRGTAARRAVAAAATAVVRDGVDSLLFVTGVMLASLRSGRRRGLAIVAGALLAALVGALLRPLPAVAAFAGIGAAGSLVFVAVEGVSGRPFTGWRAAVLAVFAALHGLRLALHAGGPGLAVSDGSWALLSAAVAGGVALPLSAAAGLAVACIACYRERHWYRERIAVPLAIAGGAAGVVWATVRLAAVLMPA